MSPPSMVMPPCGTFAYVAVVPETIADGAFECIARSRETVLNTGDRLRDCRLVGLAPRLTVTDDSLTSKEYGGQRRRDLGPFQIETFHGFIPGIPGTDESVAIARRGDCSLYAAAITATWLKALNQVADTL